MRVGELATLANGLVALGHGDDEVLLWPERNEAAADTVPEYQRGTMGGWTITQGYPSAQGVVVLAFEWVEPHKHREEQS